MAHRAVVQVINKRESMVILCCESCGYRLQLERGKKPVVLNRGSKTAHHMWDTTPEMRAIMGQ